MFPNLVAKFAEKMFNLKQQNKLPPIVEPLLLTPAHKLSKQIKDGSLTAVKLCELYTERIKQVQPLINAMTQDRFKEALEDAKRIDDLLTCFRSGQKVESKFSSDELEMLRSPLLGIPISIKESIGIKGMKNTCGMVSRKDFYSDNDAVVVKNVQRFGLIPICTSNIPECTLFWADCQNNVYGRTLNPYDLSRIPGGSSGGEAALLASGASILGIGSDIGGSLRIPAHYCGVYGHKPSPFLVSSEGNYPLVSESRLRMFTLGPMSRYASDLRPLLKCLLSDKDNAKQDTYYNFQPENISTIRKDLIKKLDEQVDLSQLKIYYCNFEDSQLRGRQSIKVQPELLDAQQEILDHFRSKFNCQTEQINLDKYVKKILITWKCIVRAGGTIDRDENYNANELEETFEIHSLMMELLKLPFGLSKHTKETLLSLVSVATIPKEKEKAYPLCEKFEKFALELKAELESKLGDNGILLMPTLPTVAHRHNISLTKTSQIRFTAIANVLQLPATHAPLRLDKKHKLPYGFSMTAKQNMDHLVLAVAEEIELAFGGWRPPTAVNTTTETTTKLQQQSLVAGGDKNQQKSKTLFSNETDPLSSNNNAKQR